MTLRETTLADVYAESGPKNRPREVRGGFVLGVSGYTINPRSGRQQAGTSTLRTVHTFWPHSRRAL